MTRILMAGLCPLPFENTEKSFGPGIRTWQMARPLAQAGHEVRLLALRIPGTYRPEQLAESEQETRDGVAIERLGEARFFDPATFAAALAEGPDAAIGATLYGSYVLARHAPQCPFWADQFGHVMAEAQAKALLEQADWPIAHFWNLLAPILRHADHLSVVSERQRWAAIGELGSAGRLSYRTCGHELVSVQPCALIPRPPVEDGEKLLRGKTFPQDAFAVFWSGGYNVWSDVDTLFAALEKVMEKEPRLHFVSTGGEIGGHDEKTYRRFEEAVALSRHRGRYHLLGWVDADLVPRYQAEMDLGILTEIPIYEGQLGHKNRVVQWMGGGLPVLYNRVGDLGELLDRHGGLGLTFEAGNSAALAGQLSWAVSHAGELTEMAERARAYTLENLTFEATTRDLVAWAAAPSHAPDAQIRRNIASPADFAPPPATMEPAPPPEAAPAPPAVRNPWWRRIWRP
jgi:glycosyltransferase involved in cell wall biosynthesis